MQKITGIDIREHDQSNRIIKISLAIKKYLDQVTRRAERQVLIEATVIEVELNDQYQTGVDWTFINNRAFGDNGGIQISSPFGGTFNGFSATTVDNLGDATVGVISGDWNILSNLNLLDEFGDSKVLSSPKIMAVNNQTALLKVVQNLKKLKPGQLDKLNIKVKKSKLKRNFKKGIF